MIGTSDNCERPGTQGSKSRTWIFLQSPAIPSALLLYGILFGFAAVSYLLLPWQKSCTIAFYISILLWATFVTLRRRTDIRLSMSSVDLFFGTFLLLVLVSAVAHWWSGTAQYAMFIPFFFLLPYFLGRMMNDSDILIFWNLLLGMGGVLLFLIPIEFAKAYLPYVGWSNPYLFSQGHGVMLSGLLLSATFLVLVSRLLLAGVEGEVALANTNNRVSLPLYVVFGLVIIVVGWISARGSAIAATLSMGVLFAFSSYCGARRKISIGLAFVFFVLIAFVNPFQAKFSKQYYQAVLQPPVIFLSGESVSDSGDTSFDEENSIPGRGKPILGEKACASINDSISDRWVHYQTALAIFFSNPLTGVGANRYGHYSCTGPGWFPHSTALQVLAELGFLGAAIYILLILTAFRAIAKRYFSSRHLATKVISGWLLGYLAFQLVTSQLYGNYFMSAGLYFVFGVASRIANDNTRALIKA